VDLYQAFFLAQPILLLSALLRQEKISASILVDIFDKEQQDRTSCW